MNSVPGTEIACQKDDSDVATSVNFGVASFFSWLKSVCSPEVGTTRIRGPLKTIASF